MKKNLLLIALCLALSSISAQTKPVRIIIPQKPTESEHYAAKQLQTLLQKGGLETHIHTRNDDTPQSGSIYVGTCPFVNTDGYRNNAYAMLGDGNFFVLSGKGEKGTLYAVYDFLERYCGYRLFTPEALETKELHSFSIPADTALNIAPAFDYREVLYFYPNNSQLYTDWHRLNNRADLNRDWGMFVHTFKNLIPHERYFDSHPEWFSMRNGQRVRDGQLCLANPYVLDTLCRNLQKMVDQNPQAKIWSVSNNDNYNVCQCSECLKLDSLYGGPTGTLLHFVNQVARRFPDKTISTLAYQFTRQAPQGLKVHPDSNVNIMFCSIECGRELPLETNPAESAFCNDMRNWQKISDNIFMWDYIVQFRNFWNPFPNLHVLQPNLRFFRDHGVKMMFEQATGEKNITSWMDIRCYLTAKLMWNPDLNADSILNDFCNGYYGNAGQYVKSIIDTMTSIVATSGQRLNIYGFAIDACESYLAPKYMNQYRKMMALAYAAATDSIIHQRLRFFELSLDFATVELAAGGAFYEDLFPEGDKLDKVRQMYSMLNRMVDDLNRFGVNQMMEMGISPDQYRELIARYIEKTFSYSNSYFRPVELRKQPTEPYTNEGGQDLTDGAGGILDYRYYWLGFYGDTLDAVISLGATDTVKHISMDFYFYPLSWIFLPQQIDYYISNDKKNWRLVGHHTPENPEILATPMIKTFNTDLDKPTKASYLRVVAIPLPQIPLWHRATGQPAWIFTDEIIVN